MRGSRNGLLAVLSEGMLLSWVYAWASFVMPMAGCRPFPLVDGALILALATLVGSLHRGRGWRVISIIALHATGFLLAALRMIYVHFEWSHSFWSREWVATMLATERTVPEWFLLLLILLWAVVLWIGGIRIALKSMDRPAFCSRFDLGAALFLLLLLIQLIMLGKGEPLNPVRNGKLSFLAFFVLGLLGLGVARIEEPAEKSYVAAYRGIGVILSFVVFVLLFGGGLVILFLPALMDAAELGHRVLKAVAEPTLPVVISVLRFVLVSGCQKTREDPPSAKPKDSGLDLPAAGGGEGGILEQIMVWGFATLGILLGLAMLSLGTWYLIRWLSSRRPGGGKPLGLWDFLLRWIGLCRALLASLLAGMMPRRRGPRGAGYHYALLLRWGSHCGLAHVPNETPLEYGSRLLRHFPMLSHEIAVIVDLFNQAVYGDVDPDAEQLTTARHACRRLRSPFLWPSRIRTWFVSPGV
jgi:hypothetical protein